MKRETVMLIARILLGVSLAATLASCGPAATPTAAPAPTTATMATEAPAPTSAPASPAASAYMPTVGQISTTDYVPQIRPAPKKYLIGFANYIRAVAFCQYVETGMRNYATQAGVNLYVVDNNADAATSVENARAMIANKVDFFIEYQGEADTNVVIGKMMKDAGIPVVAVDIPVPGAPFFGGNNSVAGDLGGEWLGQYASKNWSGQHVVLVLLESTSNGDINAKRMQGYVTGVRKYLPNLADSDVYMLDTTNVTEDALAKMRDWLSAHPDEHHILVGGLHDGVTLGGLQALRAANREADAVIISQGADPSIYAEIRNPSSAFKGSVAYFPEKYGFYTIAIAEDVLEGKPVPQSFYVPHVVIDASNIDKYYPKS